MKRMAVHFVLFAVAQATAVQLLILALDMRWEPWMYVIMAIGGAAYALGEVGNERPNQKRERTEE